MVQVRSLASSRSLEPTVSRVFTKATSVDPAKAERVRAVAKELGYIPNLVARSLNSG
ncbi:MAG: LacI family DNA-binding transcriptional regulator, partial [Pseudomonadota bacterium]